MHHERGRLVREGERLYTITDPFEADGTSVDAPFTGVLLGVLENPGNPIRHLAELDAGTVRIVERRAGER